MKILVISSAPVMEEFGAGQVAIRLAETFRKSGHEATLWSPYPIDVNYKWWRAMIYARKKINEYLNNQETFDVIDAPPIMITRLMQKRCRILVARSTQPYLLYLLSGLKNVKTSLCCLSGFLHGINKLFEAIAMTIAILFGWGRANRILCLGNIEYSWMQKKYPCWKSKMTVYVNALSDKDRQTLVSIREKRPPLNKRALKILWVGRWVPHKGTDTLINLIQKMIKNEMVKKFTLAGCGDQCVLPEGIKKSEKLNVIPGFSRQDLWDLLKGHNIGLFTSSVEGWGLSLQEMLESGMPVFASEAGAVTELRPYFQGLLFPLPVTDCALETVNISNCRWAAYYQYFNWDNIARLYLKNFIDQ